MQLILDFINNTIEYAPYVIGFALIINSVGLPISEDVLVITAGVLSAQFAYMLVPLYLSCLIGAYLGDTASYWVWRLLGDVLSKKHRWKKKLESDKIKKITDSFKRNAPGVLIIGRFIPLGVRVLICLTAGISKYKYSRFAFFDFIAALLSTGTIFTLAYFLGESVENDIKNLKFILLAVVAVFIIIYLLYKKVLFKEQGDEKK